MKLSQLYSNNPRLFLPIQFNGVADNELSVVFARVRKPKDAQRDSHNLGKTLLIDLIDFLLLKNLSDVPQHFLSKHSILFADWVFYLELQSPKGTFITVKRAVKDNTKIAFKFHPKPLKPEQDSVAIPGKWDHTDVTLDRAVQLLDGQLGLDAIKPFPYRNGVGYFLRTQADYHDLFQLMKTKEGADKTWKPYLAKVFGIDPELVTKKYELDEEVAELKKKVDEIQQTVPNVRTKNLNELKMEVSSRRQQLGETEGRLDGFKFAQEELRISKEAAEELEGEDAELNERISNLDYDIGQMRSSMQRSVTFDLDHIEKVFKETKTYFAPQLTKEYQELVQFNRTITTERSKFLKQQIKDLEKERGELAIRKAEVDEKRSRYYEILKERDTFKRFKGLQKEQASQRAHLEQRLLQIKHLQELLVAEQNHKAKQIERTKVIADIDVQVSEGTEIQEQINIDFARMVRKVLSLNGAVFLQMNQNGNIDPKYTADPPKTDAGQSSQGDGNTYKRLLCILFDLAVLKAYAKKSFFRFVYHDGILETMDDRKKIALLTLLSEFSAETGVQSIFSVIQAEMPEDADGKRVEFSEGQIIRELSDVGVNGRLFRMSPF
jgi:uncharacterized protein YydD (DUF2326 family)